MRGWRYAIVPALLVLAFAGLAALVTWSDLPAQERAAVAEAFNAQRVSVLVILALGFAAAVGFAAKRIADRTAVPARKVAEGMRLMLSSNPGFRVAPEGAPEIADVAALANQLADANAALKADVEAKIGAARADLEAEKNRLAALMSELASSVLVCNLEGAILLYNGSAKRLLGGADGSLVGLGRSVFGALDRNVILHALDSIGRQIANGAAHPDAQFVAAGPEGGLMRVRVAPVLGHGEGGRADLTGYVLLVADVTDSIDAGQRRDALLQSLTESGRAALANIRASIENLVEFADMKPERRAQFTGIIRDEALKLSERLDAVTREFSEVVKAEYSVEEMRGEDLVAVACARIESRVGLPTKLETIDPDVWLKVDSFSIAQGLSYLASRLKEDFDIREVRFRLAASGRHAQLDLLWRGAPLSAETAFNWENDPLHLGGEPSPLTLKNVLERHGGEGWYQRDLPLQSAYYRLVLPLAAAPARTRIAAPSAASRPEYYDFDLFRQLPQNRALEERPLAELALTVFDTETTGLDPSSGDEIISIGAVRIVNGRLLAGESFESLVDPKRELSAASIDVHGITPEMLAGQPAIGEVLPRFARFAEGTVLVAHNAAFDMRFLAMKESATGVRFTQPVLDTLLLSAVANPNQETHSLEAIAERLGVAIVGRHTALGDALVTGEVFLRLVPLLAKQGIRTLGEARAASEKTFYARVTY
ncbi:MAG: exonuclease domain-containing protein [Burkholderiales bacterium]|jgi:DNA polymerase-3 subunit epsilon|nr:exonuclease domain-containing protein [Burkholderiales bacterium]